MKHIIIAIIALTSICFGFVTDCSKLSFNECVEARKKELHSNDYFREKFIRVGGIRVLYISSRNGTDEDVSFCYDENVEGTSRSLDCADGLYEKNIPIYYKGERIAVVNIYIDPNEASGEIRGTCEITGKSINHIKACTRHFK